MEIFKSSQWLDGSTHRQLGLAVMLSAGGRDSCLELFLVALVVR